LGSLQFKNANQVAATSCIGVMCVFLYNYTVWREEEELKQKEEENKLKAENNKVKSSGQAKVGGPFELSDLKGNTVTEQYLVGKWSIIYFGFTHCPDVCPEELEKLGEIVDLVGLYTKQKTQPIFISVDPKRDTPAMITQYLTDFHPAFLGLTGTPAQIRKVTRAYRVYYSEGPALADDENDYMVDHTIVMYLIDPAGKFCKHFSQRSTAEGAASTIVDAMVKYKEEEGQSE